MAKEGGRKRKRRIAGWFSQNDRESLLVGITTTVAFLGIAVMIIFMADVVISSERLQMTNDIERSFNDIIFALDQGRTQTGSVMSDDKVNGVGIYNASGSLVMSWGRVYNMLPVGTLTQQMAEVGDSVIVSFDEDSRTAEYIRFVQHPLMSSTSLLSAAFTGASALSDQSHFIFISFDGSEYISQRNMIRLVSLLAIAGVILLYVFVMSTNRENRQYKEKMAKQDNLAALGQAARTLTHEIKNPLSAITIQVALLKRQLRDSEYLDEVALIESETQRLIHLTNRVSDFLRNPEGQPEQVDVAAMVDQLVPLFAYPVKVLEGSLKHAYVLFDQDRLRSVIENIIKNGCESCEGRDPQVEIEIVLGRGGMYHIYIRDRGDGIQGDPEKLFDPFYTTKIHGSGIGLAISRQFLQARGGDIKLSPRPGGGTVVELVIAKYSFVQELVVQGARRKKEKGGLGR